MSARMYDSRRCGFCHLPSCFANDIGLDAGLEIHPLGCVLPHVLGQLFEADRVALDVVLVVQLLVDQYVHPREQQGHIGARLDGQPVFRLARRH